MEEIKDNILKHLLKKEGTVKDFTEMISKVEVFFSHTGCYPYNVTVNGQTIAIR